MTFRSNQVRKVRLNKEEILKRVSPLSIYERYFGREVIIGRMYRSPFRDEKDPSFGFYFTRTGTLRFNDFASKQRGDCFDFIKELYGTSFKDSLEIVNRDFKLGLDGDNPKAENKRAIEYKVKEKSKIQISIKEFTDEELAYWLQFGATLPLLKKHKVFSVNQLIINGFVREKADEDLTFAYYFKESDSVKIYRPFNKKYKWTGNTTAEDIFGLEALEGEIPERLIIASSMKDLLTLESLGFTAIAPQSESASIPLSITEYLKDSEGKLENLYILFDNDKPGETSGKKWATTLNAKQIRVEEEKDISDYYKRFGREKTLELINKQLNESN
jgi:DNA primase